MIYVTQEQLQTFQQDAANYIETTKTDDSIIIGVSRGGLVPAVYVSHLSGLPMVPVDYSADEGRGTSKHTNIIPPLDKYQTIYIIDDIVDTGITVKHLKDWFEHKGHIVHVLAVVYKYTSCIVPELSYMKSSSAEWVIFPWEKVNGKEESKKAQSDEGAS